MMAPASSADCEGDCRCLMVALVVVAENYSGVAAETDSHVVVDYQNRDLGSSANWDHGYYISAVDLGLTNLDFGASTIWD